MKVLVVGAFPPSLINFRGPLLREMAKLGHEVWAVAADDRGVERDINGFRGNVSAILEGWGIKYKAVPVHRAGMKPWQDIGTMLALFRLMIRVRPDVVLKYMSSPEKL